MIAHSSNEEEYFNSIYAVGLRGGTPSYLTGKNKGRIDAEMHCKRGVREE
jgi:hypothetical protein